MSPRRLLPVLAGLLALVPAAHAAPPGCSDGRFLLRPEDGQLIVGAAGRDAITVVAGRVAIDSGCPAERARSARVTPTRRGTKVKAAWDLCREQQKVRLLATITRASGCQDMTGIRRARRSSPKRWVATRSRCGDGYVDAGNQEACDGGTCPDGQACTGECTCPPSTTTTTSTTTSTSSSTSTSATSSTSTSSSRTTSTSSSTSTTSTSTSSSTSRTSTTSSSTSTSSTTSVPDPCPHNEAGGPSHLVLRSPLDGAGGDLDVGWRGDAHNLPLPGGARLDVCLTGCGGADSVCAGTSPAGTDGAPLGPPVPMLAGTAPFCLVTRLTGDVIVRTADYQTGALDAAVGVTAELYATTNVARGTLGQICPQCTSLAPDQGGTCVGGRDDGAPCRLEATRFVLDSTGNQDYRLSSSCRPAGTPVATVSLTLDPLRTDTVTAPECPDQTTEDACGGSACIDDCSLGSCAFAVPDPVNPGGPLRCQDEKGGLSEHCCEGGDNDRPCHQGTVARTGRAVAPTPDGAPPFPASSNVVLAAGFCVGATGNATVDGTTVGLPAPGAVLLPVRATWLP